MFPALLWFAPLAVPHVVWTMLFACVVVGSQPLAMHVGRWLLNLNAWVDGRAPVVKQLVAAVVSVAATTASLELGRTFPTTLAQLAQANDVLLYAANGGLMFLLHAAVKQREAAAAPTGGVGVTPLR